MACSKKLRAIVCCGAVLPVVIFGSVVALAQRAAPDFSSVDSIIQQSISAGDIPGAVLLVGHGEKVVYRKAFGMRSLEPQREPMTVDTIFDVASLTKPVATAPAVMLLVQQGKVRLNDPVARYLPEFATNGKQDITIRQLLTHFSGLRPDLDTKTSWQGYDAALALAYAEQPIAPPGARFIYSDVNYIVLGELVRRVSGMPLDEFAQKNFLGPLGMVNTRFRPPPEWLARIAPTQYDENGAMLRGVVHDPSARRTGGVAGNAGLFSTADDLARFAQAMIDRKGILNPLIIEKMTHSPAAGDLDCLAGTRMGHRFAILQQPRRAAPRALLRAHRLYWHIDLDRSRHEHVCHPADQCRASAWREWEHRFATLAGGECRNDCSQPGFDPGRARQDGQHHRI